MLALVVVPNLRPRVVELREEGRVRAHERLGVLGVEHVDAGDARVDDRHGQEGEEEAGEEADDAQDDGPACRVAE